MSSGAANKIDIPPNDALFATTSLFEMLWRVASPEAAEQDRAEYQRLCQSGSPDLILNQSDYYAFFTYTLFAGKVSKPTS